MSMDMFKFGLILCGLALLLVGFLAKLIIDFRGSRASRLSASPEISASEPFIADTRPWGFGTRSPSRHQQNSTMLASAKHSEDTLYLSDQAQCSQLPLRKRNLANISRSS